MTDRTSDKRMTHQSGFARLQVMVVSLILILSLALVALDRLLLPERFAINEVVITGDAPNVDPAMVLRAVKSLGPRSWFSVDLDEVEVAVNQVPWVYRANVRRRWPGKLVVTVAQAQPFARFNDAAWINQAGEVLTLPEEFRDPDLPRLFGPPARPAGDVVDSFRRLLEPFSRVEGVSMRSLSMDPRGTIRIGLVARSGETSREIAVTVGREAQLERVARLADVLAGVGLGTGLDQVEAIDLRYPNGFAVRPAGNRPREKDMADSMKSRARADTG